MVMIIYIIIQPLIRIILTLSQNPLESKNVNGLMAIAQYSGFKGAYPDFAFVAGFCLLFMRQSLCIKGFPGRAWEPGGSF